ncbi:MAG: carboxypeptidase regulatory-like domain-containing protein, partial [Myxococcales bacterium]|nr:carboxypeptidase regulatory-like domain-containing protein [Myxococcales bacterium]
TAKIDELRIITPVSITGSVTWSGHPDAVEAEIVFSRESQYFDPTKTTYSTRTFDEPVSAPDGSPANYAVNVISDKTYTMRVNPVGDGASMLPPLEREVRIEEVGAAGGADFVRVDISYPETFETLMGRVVNDQGVEEDGILVRAVDRKTGATLSSRATTGMDGSPGTFTLSFASADVDYVIRISGGSDRPEVPTFTIDPDYLVKGKDGRVGLLVPDLATISYAARVELGDGSPVTGATIALRAEMVIDEDTGITGFHQATATTDEKGVFVANLLPARYDVLVSPGGMVQEGLANTSGGSASVGTFALLVSKDQPPPPPSGADAFVLRERVQYEGLLETFDGRQLPGASIQALALGQRLADSDDTAELYNRSSDAVDLTDADGRFAIALDRGAYHGIAKPPSDSGFPWVVKTGFSVKDVEDGEPLTLRSTTPVRLQGTILDGLGAPIGGAEIRAFGIFPSDEETSRTVPIGRSVSAQDGTYDLLLPPSL